MENKRKRNAIYGAQASTHILIMYVIFFILF